MKLYHFRDEEYGLKTIRERRLKIARIMELNDPFEFLALKIQNPPLRHAMNATKRALDKKNGLLCFSGNWNNPVQWSHYADHHRGLCMEFEVNDKLVKKVNYRATRIPIKGKPNQAEMKQLLCTKFKHWSYEQEYRALIKLDQMTQEGGKYYMNFDEDLTLTGVIIGAESSITRHQLADALSDLDANVKAFKARAAFTKFEVIRNEKEGRWI